MSEKKLIVGLGNPGKKYIDTRHNLGFKVIEVFADKLGVSFKKKLLLQSQVAEGNYEGLKLSLLFPITYMNLSGSAVIKALHWYGLSLEDLIVIVDDVALPFGTLRFREKGSCGGHNGLRDIERVLGTEGYARIKMGIGSKSMQGEPLERYVLAAFREEERLFLPDVLDAAIEVLKSWLVGGAVRALQEVEVVNEKLTGLLKKSQ